MKVVTCSYQRHAAAILAILNEAIENSTALYDYRPRAPDSMVSWFGAKEAGGFPVVGLESPQGELLGFGSYGTFRAWPAYKYTVEHSVYVHHAHRHGGIGTALTRELIARAGAQQIHVMIGGIDATNIGSISMHTKLGFVHAGTITQAGFKFGRWLDLAFYQLTLETPINPIDG
jgi:phosphinothricin acetyltransferase